jgi:hypothetical protein
VVDRAGARRQIADREPVAGEERLDETGRVAAVGDPPLAAGALSDPTATQRRYARRPAKLEWERFHTDRSELPHTKGGFSRVGAITCSKKRGSSV